jgi:molecular chaperone DnaK
MGAAIYSEGRDWSNTAAGAKSSRGSRKPKGPLDIRYDFPARTADDRVRIRVRSGSGIDKKGYRLVVDTEDGWTSGQIALEENMEIKDVPLGKRGENVIRITVLDGKGAPIADALSELSIFRALATAAGMPITHTIAVKVVKNAAGVERNTLVPLVKKGISLPTSGMDKFRAARDLRANDGSSLDFELFEQTEGVDDPELNLPIGVFRISSTDLERGDVIRKGDDIFVRWTIDGNGLLDPELEIPTISKRYSTGRMYVSTRDHRNFDGEDGTSLAVDVINSAEDDINRLDKALGPKVAHEISNLQDRLARQREALRLAHEADTRRAVSEEGRFIRQEVARIRNSPENIKSSLRSEIDEFVEAFSVDFASSSDPKINSQVHWLAGLARDALMKDDRNSIEDARRSLDEMRAIVLSDLAKRPGFWVGMFEDLAKDRHRAIDKSKHDQLANEGEAHIRKEDIDGLRQVTFQLRDNMVRSADASSPDVLAGLMR